MAISIAAAMAKAKERNMKLEKRRRSWLKSMAKKYNERKPEEENIGVSI
jgi:hypothetical protein